MNVLLRIVVLLAALATWPGFASAAGADERYAEQLGELINRYRASHGSRELGDDRALDALAREHSVAMAKAGRLSHDGFQSRFRRSGYGLCVENVGWNFHTPQAQLDAWRKSPGHDRNLRDVRVTRAGIGLASDYVTWIACR